MAFISMSEVCAARKSSRGGGNGLKYTKMAYAINHKGKTPNQEIDCVVFYMTPDLLKKSNMPVGTEVDCFFEPTTKEGFIIVANEKTARPKKITYSGASDVSIEKAKFKVAFPYFKDLGFPIVNKKIVIDDNVHFTKGKIEFSLKNINT